jgi:hypothetical protein
LHGTIIQRVLTFEHIPNFKMFSNLLIISPKSRLTSKTRKLFLLHECEETSSFYVVSCYLDPTFKHIIWRNQIRSYYRPGTGTRKSLWLQQPYKMNWNMLIDLKLKMQCEISENWIGNALFQHSSGFCVNNGIFTNLVIISASPDQLLFRAGLLPQQHIARRFKFWNQVFSGCRELISL